MDIHRGSRGPGNIQRSNNDIIQVQVGERRFITTRETLTSESQYFRTLLASLESQGKVIFVDADADLFEHVLRYLRHGVMPLFYDRAQGHDFARYRAVAAVAEDLGVAKLTDWLQQGTYADVVRTHRTVELHCGIEPEGLPALTADARAGLGTTVLHPRWSSKQSYFCPYLIPGHAENPAICQEECPGPPVERDRWFTTPILDLLAVKEEVVVDWGSQTGLEQNGRADEVHFAPSEQFPRTFVGAEAAAAAAAASTDPLSWMELLYRR